MQEEGFTLAESAAHLNMLPTVAKFGFTLAEVLITLGIIGIVAAITLPNLIQNNKATKLRSQFLKSYSVISQAIRLMENDDISPDPKSYKNREYYKVFSNYLTNATDCGGYSQGDSTNLKRPDGCYSYTMGGEYKEGYKKLTGNNYIGDGAFNEGQLMLPDGTLILFDDSPVSEGWKGTVIYVDINGYKNKPNRLGYDFFAFEIVDGTLYAMGDIKTTCVDNKDKDCNCTKAGAGMTCASRAKSNSDYFKMVVKNYK